MLAKAGVRIVETVGTRHASSIIFVAIRLRCYSMLDSYVIDDLLICRI